MLLLRAVHDRRAAHHALIGSSRVPPVSSEGEDADRADSTVKLESLGISLIREMDTGREARAE